MSRGDSIEFYVMSLTDTSSRTVWLRLPSDLDVSDRDPLVDFYITGDRIAMLFGYRFVIYDTHARGEMSHIVDEGILEQYYMRIWLVGDTVFCSSFDYYFHGGSTWMARCVIPSTTADEFALTTPPSGDIFSLIKREPISVSPSGLIAVADVDKYNVRLFSASFDPLETLHRDTSDWQGSTFDSVKFGNLHPRNAKGQIDVRSVLHKLFPLEQKSRLIARVDFLDSHTLMVTYSKSGSYKEGAHKGTSIAKFDIWREHSGKWQLAFHDLGDSNPPATALLTCNSDNWPIWRSFGCGSRQIVRVVDRPITKVGESFEKVLKDSETYVKLHGPMCTLFVFSFVK